MTFRARVGAPSRPAHAPTCWGWPEDGRLGYGNGSIVRRPESGGDVPISGTAVAVTASDRHTCALLTNGRLRCWGSAAEGRLGYGNDTAIGDDEPASAAGNVPVGMSIRLRARTFVGASVRPKRDRRAPYVYRLGGRVRSAYPLTTELCTGPMKIVVAKAGRTIARRTTRLRPDCTFGKRVVIWPRKLGTRRTTLLKIRIRFGGTTNLTPARRTLRVRAN